MLSFHSLAVFFRMLFHCLELWDGSFFFHAVILPETSKDGLVQFLEFCAACILSLKEFADLLEKES